MPKRSKKQRTRVFLLSIYDIDIKGAGKEDIEIGPETYLTCNPARTKSLVSTRMRRKIGELEALGLFESKAVVYSESDVLYSVSFGGGFDPDSEIRVSLGFVETFLQSLWYIRDNAAYSQMGFLETHLPVLPGGRKLPSMITSQLQMIRYSTARGGWGEGPTFFSVDEIQEAAAMATASLERVHEDSKDIENPTTGAYRGVGKLTRVEAFLSSARSANDLGVKIAHYMTCLETLFSTDTAELSHKLSERTALFLSNSPSDRMDTYRAVKSAYGVRSKIVHGDTIAPSLGARLPEISEQCDTMLRKVLNRLRGDKESLELLDGKQDTVDSHFLNLSFGDLPPQDCSQS